MTPMEIMARLGKKADLFPSEIVEKPATHSLAAGRKKSTGCHIAQSE